MKPLREFDETALLPSARGNASGEETNAALEHERSISSAILDTVPAMVLVLDPDFKIVRFNRACEMSTGYLFLEVAQEPVWVLFDTREDVDAFRAAAERLRKNARSGDFESRWRKRDGSPVVIRWSVTGLFNSRGGIRLVIATGIDLTENKRLENAVLEISAREQRRIGQDLHDGLGQHLTGIAFLAKVQQQKMAEKSLPEAVAAGKIVDLVNEAIHKTRELARGLLPVLSGPHGLISALQEWATEVEDIFRVECRLECDDLVAISDDSVANHLFRIAQEAVHNAIRHGRARKIVMSLRDMGDEGALTIYDEGSGISLNGITHGMGLRIMDYRARVIGGSLTVERAGEGGTSVACVFPLRKRKIAQ